ncbi:MAG: hypothetical protein K6L80_01435 [Agarilytica sp.]
MDKRFLILTLVFIASLSGCSAVPVAEQLVGPDLQREDWDKPSEVYSDLANLPKPRGKIVASIYSFRDLTGQYKPQPSSSFSTAVSQGAASMLVKAINDSGWFSALEREGLQDLLTERKIIRAALKNRSTNAEVPPLLGANILLEGGIIGYETNMKTGGAGAKYFGVGMSEQYRVDQVTVNLRVVDVNTGRVINSVTTARSILSRAVQGGAFRFVRFKRLLEVEGGYTRNEPVQLCLLEAIQAAVMKIIVEGVEDNSWSLADASEINHPLLYKYGTRVSPNKQDSVQNEYVSSATQKQSVKVSHKGSTKLLSSPSRRINSSQKNTKSELNRTRDANPSLALSQPVGMAGAKASASIKERSDSARSEMKGDRVAVNVHEELIQKDDGEWVIQLMSSGSAMEVLAFARENKLRRDMIEYIHYQVKGQDRFAIVYGQFRSKSLALRAIESLPPKLRIFEPWVRIKNGMS